ncbi:hypothetical protein NC651_016004 [Populus alba x Populus x berolinensis]|nr:hypothetical protein NC651_015967 [Populus alba x Populus x berolinensis]KAJ6913636.1 hypothetical protein NC651_016004 [Populus alba x Populus x berolinensis]
MDSFTKHTILDLATRLSLMGPKYAFFIGGIVIIPLIDFASLLNGLTIHLLLLPKGSDSSASKKVIKQKESAQAHDENILTYRTGRSVLLPCWLPSPAHSIMQIRVSLTAASTKIICVASSLNWLRKRNRCVVPLNLFKWVSTSFPPCLTNILRGKERNYTDGVLRTFFFES